MEIMYVGIVLAEINKGNLLVNSAFYFHLSISNNLP